MTRRIRPNPIRRPKTRAQRIANGCFDASMHSKTTPRQHEEVDRLRSVTGLRVRP